MLYTISVLVLVPLVLAAVVLGVEIFFRKINAVLKETGHE
jgi:hypothetical protein